MSVVRMRERRALVMLAVAMGVSAAVGVVLSIRRGQEPATAADTAQVLGTYWTIVGGVLALVAWAASKWFKPSATSVTATPGQVEDAADLFAERTLQTWARQATARGIVTPAPVRVHWRWATPDLGATRDELNRARSLDVDPVPLRDQGAEVLASGVVARLHDEVYARLRHGRLVLIGAPGTGKTGAMLLLLLAALRYRHDLPDEERARVPVPLWLTLGSWNPDEQGLRDWVIQSLQRDHPYLKAADFGPDAPARLFDTARIALFLDGLDELPDAHRPRAAQRLQEESTGLRVVLTSRPDEYRAILQACGQVPNTAVLQMRPVGARASVEYLLADRTSIDADRWALLTTHLTTHPHGVLADIFSTPLNLSLARAAYQPINTDPGDLLHPDLDAREAVRGHLLDQSVISAYPDQRERDHARYWLGWLAHHMNTHPGGPTRDLAWWRIPSYLPRRQHFLAQYVKGLVVGLVFGLAAGLTIGLTAGLVFGLLIGLLSNLTAGLVFGLAGLADSLEPRTLTPRGPSRHEVRDMLRESLMLGLVASLLVGLALGLAGGPTFGLTVGLTAGLAFALWISVWDLLSIWGKSTSVAADMTPRRTYEAETRFSLTAGVALGFATMLAAGLVLTLTLAAGGFTGGLTVGLAGGLAFGLIFGLVFGLAGSAAGLAFAQVGLWLTTRRKVRFMRLLEHALDRQVMRQAGTVYQFRHAELQDRLADRYECGTSTRAAVGAPDSMKPPRKPSTGADSRAPST